MFAKHFSCLVALLLITTSFGCPPGLELVGKQCVSTEVLQPSLVCPPGTTSLNGECVTFAPAFKVCSKGLTAVGDRCTSTQVVPASLVCDQGQLVTDQCQITVQVPPVCPAGLQLQNGQCIRYTSQQEVCPPNYQPQGRNCVKSVSLVASPICPSGFSLAGIGQCTQLIPASPRCNVGFSLFGSECVKQVAQVPAPCPYGFTASGKGCQRRQETPVRPACFSKGCEYGLNSIVRRSPQLCDVGSKQGAVCVQVEEVPRQQICPFGSEDRGGRCIVTSAIITPEPSVLTRPAQYICPDGSTASGKSCFRNEIVSVEYVCRDGGIREGSMCVHRGGLIYQPAQISYSPARSVCPQGYQQQGRQCSLTTAEPAALQCPSGFSLSYGAAQECVRSHARVAVCPAGTQQSSKGCVKHTYTPPQVTEVRVCSKGC